MNLKKITSSNMPAFPLVDDGGMPFNDIPDEACTTGITKREMFAMHAMQGLLSNSGGPVQSSPMSGFHFCNCDESDVAKLSVSLAEALLNELEK